MKNRATLSIVTATYNSEKTLTETLKSLSNQVYKNIEHIVVDGLSKDKTLEILKSKGLNNTQLISEIDNGIFDALNKGIQRSTGDILGFLHSDDCLPSPNTLSKVVDTFNITKCDAVYGDLEYVSDKNPNRIIRKWVSGEFTKNSISKGWMPPHPTFYMRKVYYEKLGGFDLQYNISSDYDALLRYLLHEDLKIVYIPEVLSRMKIGGNSNQIKNIIPKMKEDYNIMKSHNINAKRALLFKNLTKIKQFF